MQDGFIGLKARPLRGQPGARELYVQSANLESELALLVGSKASVVVRRRGAAENLRSPISFRHISPSVRVSSATYDWLACLVEANRESGRLADSYCYHRDTDRRYVRPHQL